MDWPVILQQVAEMQKAYKDLPLAQQAQKINDAFAHQPIIGWLLLKAAHDGGVEPEEKEPHG